DVVPENEQPTDGNMAMDVVAHLRVDDVLIGSVGGRRLDVVLYMMTFPEGPELRDIYVFAEARPGQRLRALEWRYASDGYCSDEPAVRELHIEREVAALNAAGRLRCAPENER